MRNEVFDRSGKLLSYVDLPDPLADPNHPTVCQVGTTDGVTFPDPSAHLTYDCAIRAVNPSATPGAPNEWQYNRSTQGWYIVSGLASVS